MFPRFCSILLPGKYADWKVPESEFVLKMAVMKFFRGKINFVEGCQGPHWLDIEKTKVGK